MHVPLMSKTILNNTVTKFDLHVILEVPCSVIDFWSKRSKVKVTQLENAYWPMVSPHFIDIH